MPRLAKEITCGLPLDVFHVVVWKRPARNVQAWSIGRKIGGKGGGGEGGGIGGGGGGGKTVEGETAAAKSDGCTQVARL